MILRRVIDHFRKQEWTAIAIDFLIVVVGVFVGIQVANWNEARADHDRARAYLERLGADIEADIASAERKMLFWAQVSAYGATGLSYSETGATDGKTQWDILLAYFQASQVDEFFVADTTYQEMKSAGELVLIKDAALRGALGKYYSLGGNVALTERPRYREHVRGLIPIEIQSYIWTNCYDTDEQGEQSMMACGAPAPEAGIAHVVARISEDETLAEELRYWMSTLQVASLIADDSVSVARRIKSMIDAALGRDAAS